jgi:hypothetical protein
MIDISIYSEKLDIALRQKGNSSYSKKIASELAKPEWQQQLFELERMFSIVKDEQDFQKYQNTLSKLFDDIYEVITAPGVDDFIGWMNEITNDKNNANAKKLRDYLVEHYSETSISESIEIIISNKQVLDIENSIFTSLLSEVSKELKKETTTFLKDPTQFENNIDGYFESITSTLEGLFEIEELNYISFEELYTDAQKTNNIGFYDNIIKAIFEKGQSLKSQNENEKSQVIIAKVQTRIDEIKKGILILYDSKIASSDDETLKNIFLKLDKEVKYDKGISNSLSQFIDETWAEIEGHYLLVKEFFAQTTNISYDTNWDSFSKKGTIMSIVDDYKMLANDNILLHILNKSVDVTIKQLKTKAKAIEKYSELESKSKIEIESEFTDKISEYGSQSKKQLLESLSVNNKDLTAIKKDIELNIEGIKGGITKIKECKKLILFLKDDFSYVLNNLNDVRLGFETFLQKSGRKPHLDWVDDKMKGAEIGSFGPEDLLDATLIRELLEQGLIKIEFKKTY